MWAFRSTGLESIEIPQSVEEIGEGAFENCSKLATALLPAHLKATKRDQFRGCGALKEIMEY